ncbi:hypothetical protein AMS68_006358 [Peltaster fructicola]|uniref:Uncharacterized protein n=1 Tax=Peltaster fructicola TaxID=286661 RepID=A0A6H0Y1Q1_9PEZI|nr:hypothetical protein AMS68_006358 [Peltaster fructicola]
MDVTQTSFYPLLVDILHDLSKAHFVAFDLELSGVPVKQNRGQQSGRPSLQERYIETKAAAQKFSILQFGLTCVIEDTELGKYVCRPYNFEISPLIDDTGLGIEREFTFSSGAVSFLHTVDFDFAKPFNVGVQHLSRAECSLARENFEKRQRKDAVADMHIKDTDVQALALMKSTRRSIDIWLRESRVGDVDTLLIAPKGAGTAPADSASLPPEFNGFQRRLIHQLVRAEYPNLVSFSTRGGIQIGHLDQEREARILTERKADNNTRINKQKGFRWVIDALLGEDISSLDLSFCAHDPLTGEAVSVDKDEMRGRFSSATYRLRGRPRVMVGHNCFLDLVYIYHTFIGQLPDTVEEFSQALHSAWPTIIDTKYMATHNCGDISPASSLEEIAYQLRPRLGEDELDTVDEDHNKYVEVDHFHEAGFDSLLTGQIAIRLSRKLDREDIYIKDLEDDMGGVSISGAVKKTKSVLDAALSSVGLTKPSQSSGFIPADPDATWKTTGEPTLKPQDPDDPFKFEPGLKYIPYVPTPEEVKGIMGGMPRFDGDFWRVYGNNLRVFGTQEGLLALNASVGK